MVDTELEVFKVVLKLTPEMYYEFGAWCGAYNSDNYYCSRTPGHSGFHVAMYGGINEKRPESRPQLCPGKNNPWR